MPRIIAAHAVDCPGTQAHDQAHETFLTAQARVPDQRTDAVCHPGHGWEVILVMALPLHFLQQDRHAFVIIQ